MREICTINGEIWSDEEIGDQKPGLKPRMGFNYMFYDQDTGKVWGQRIVIGADVAPYHYLPGEPAKMNMILPIEVNQDSAPLGLLAAAFIGMTADLDLPTIPE